MNEELFEDEIIDENTADVVENETSDSENVSDSSDTVISDESIDEGVTLDDVQNDEQNENMSFTQEQLEQVLTSVLESERVATEEKILAMKEELTLAETEAVVEVPVRTLFNTPLDEFSVDEGLLLCIFILLFAYFLNSIFKGSHWFGKF